MIGLIDGNNFFASCERVFQPRLNNKPLIILSSNDGCVIARSNEAKALGIQMGTPLFKIKGLLSTHSINLLSSNFALYGDLSRRMMTLIRQTVPHMEISSIDEAFIDMKGLENPLEMSRQLQQTILQGIGVPTCVGMGNTKTLAKLANHIAKKSGVPVYVLHPHQIPSHIEVGDVWGVGSQMQEALHARGIRSVVQLQQVDPRWMRQRFSVVGERIVRELQGVRCLLMHQAHDAKQSIQISRSFGRSVTSLEDLHEAVAIHIERLGEKLRDEKLMTNQVMLDIQTSRFHANKVQGSNLVAWDVPTHDTQTLLRAILPGVQQLYERGVHYKKAGLVAMNLITSGQKPYKRNLFGALPTSPPAVSHALDAINKKYGKRKVHFGASGMGEARDWMVKCDHQSPHYTTRWEDLLKVG